VTCEIDEDGQRAWRKTKEEDKKVSSFPEERRAGENLECDCACAHSHDAARQQAALGGELHHGTTTTTTRDGKPEAARSSGRSRPAGAGHSPWCW